MLGQQEPSGGLGLAGLASFGASSNQTPKPLFSQESSAMAEPRSLATQSSMAASGAGAGGGLGLGLGGSKWNPLEGTGNLNILQFLDSLQSTLRSSGFNESQVAEIMPAMQVRYPSAKQGFFSENVRFTSLLKRISLFTCTSV